MREIQFSYILNGDSYTSTIIDDTAEAPEEVVNNYLDDQFGIDTDVVILKIDVL